MTQISTSPDLQNIIIQRLRQWQLGNTDPPGDFVPPALREAAAEQDSLGWYNFFMGFTSTRWMDIQAAHFTRIGSRKTPERWMAALIQKQWDIAGDIWYYRNDILHADELTAAQVSSRDRIRLEFTHGHKNINALNPLFRQSKAQLCKADLATQQRWIQLVTTIRTRERRKRATTPVARMRQFMDTYFKVAPK